VWAAVLVGHASRACTTNRRDHHRFVVFLLGEHTLLDQQINEDVKVEGVLAYHCQ